MVDRVEEGESVWGLMRHAISELWCHLGGRVALFWTAVKVRQRQAINTFDPNFTNTQNMQGLSGREGGTSLDKNQRAAAATKI